MIMRISFFIHKYTNISTSNIILLIHYISSIIKSIYYLNLLSHKTLASNNISFSYLARFVSILTIRLQKTFLSWTICYNSNHTLQMKQYSRIICNYHRMIDIMIRVISSTTDKPLNRLYTSQITYLASTFASTPLALF